MAIEVHDLEWSDGGEEHVVRHGVAVSEVNQVVAGPHVIVRNRRRRSANYLMVGTTFGGRVLTVAIRKTSKTGTWRVATAHPSTDAQRQVLADNTR